MKPRLIPLFFQPGRDEDFDRQMDVLRRLLDEHAELLEPLALGTPLPQAEAVIFPQMLGEAYRQLPWFKEIDLPILIVTSEFGTVSMWDWEIASYLRAEGVETIAPYNLEQTRLLCRGLGVKRELKQARFLVFQDNPGQGFQAEIFKRFYWWEEECTQRMGAKFGLSILKKSFADLGARARQIPDQQAEALLEQWPLHTASLTPRALNSALKIYLVVKDELDQDPAILGAGINCLNESHFSDTTPCLAWNMLYEQRRLIWGCEADTLSMLTGFLLHGSLGAPFMMTNLYPFLMGQAALKHEKIPEFPPIAESENCILAAHCGYLGVVPASFSTEWTLRPKVLAIVDDNASAIDARLPVGPITLAKLSPGLDRLSVVEGQLLDYAQYPGSHCLNGAVIRVPDGRRLMQALESHHYLILTGHHRANSELIARLFDLEVEAL
jgi:hypothetical protein